MTLPPRGVTVTDHAVLRYLERVEGLDIVAIRAAIAARVSNAMDKGAKAVKVDGFRYALAPDVRTVVTVTPVDRPYERPKPPRFREAAE